MDGSKIIRFNIVALVCVFAFAGETGGAATHAVDRRERAHADSSYECGRLDYSICHEVEWEIKKRNASQTLEISQDAFQRLFDEAKAHLIVTLGLESLPAPEKERALSAVRSAELAGFDSRKKLEKQAAYSIWCGKNGQSPNLYWSANENKIVLCAGIFRWFERVGYGVAEPSLYHRYVHELAHSFATLQDPHALELYCDRWANKTLGYRLLSFPGKNFSKSKNQRWDFLVRSVKRFCFSEGDETHPAGGERLKQVSGEEKILKALGCVKK